MSAPLAFGFNFYGQSRTDAFVNSLLIEILTILTLRPALVFFDWARVDPVRSAVGSLPVVVQVLALLLVADFTQYWVHRSFHATRLLWPITTPGTPEKLKPETSNAQAAVTVRHFKPT